MYLIPIILVVIVLIVYELMSKGYNWVLAAIGIGVAILIAVIVVAVDYNIQITDHETWSGSITDVGHKEEWDEWHPPYYTTESVYDSKGKFKGTKEVYHPGRWEHHYAENWIETSDAGKMDVHESPDGKEFNDDWPNTVAQLNLFWKVGDPSASVHTYKNYVQASYSVYKHKDINLKYFKGLPEYPAKERDLIHVDRFLGSIPDKDIVLRKIAQWNTKLNEFIPDPEKPGKMRSWKQVNLIFVNLGDVPEDWGFALQDHWENGNKNDFVVSFAADDTYNVKWAYPFSWADTQSSELLKIKVREYLMNKGNVSDFVLVVDDVSGMVAELFERKQMAEFSYLKISTSGTGMVVLWIFMILCAGLYVGIRKYVY